MSELEKGIQTDRVTDRQKNAGEEPVILNDSTNIILIFFLIVKTDEMKRQCQRATRIKLFDRTR